MKLLVLFLAVWCSSVSRVVSTSVSFYVDSVHGNDNNTGTSLSSPFRTITRSRDAIRSYGGNLPLGGITVLLRGGDYTPPPPPPPSSSSSSVLSLDPQLDSGTIQSPITYTAYNGEVARLVGGVPVPVSLFTRSSSSSSPNVYTADLSSLGITSGDVGSLASGALGQCTSGKAMALYVNGTSQVRARWPNVNATTGRPTWTNVAATSKGDLFEYATSGGGGGGRQALWMNESDGWVHGYWVYGWADNYVRIVGGNTTNNTLFTDPSTPPLYDAFTKEARYYGTNMLCELDAENEYYIDRDSRRLYVYSDVAPSSQTWTDIYVSTAASVVSSTATTTGRALEHVHFVGLSMLYAQGDGISIANASHVTISECNVSHHGGGGVSIDHGDNVLVHKVQVTNVGCAGVSVSGGDEVTLTPSNITVDGCIITHYATMCRTYEAGVAWRGVGIHVLNTVVASGPHTGMLGGGNNCVFDGNTFDDLCYEVTDSGAWYSGRSWAKRGHIIRNNVFRNIRTMEKTYLGFPSVQAIYFDDQLSAASVVNNVFINCDSGVFIGGGRRVLVSGNTFFQCDVAVHIDDRGLNWEKSSCQPDGMYAKELEQLDYQNPPYSTHYPQLPTIFDPWQRPCWPVFHNVSDNRYCTNDGVYAWTDFDIAKAIGAWNATIQDNVDIGSCSY